MKGAGPILSWAACLAFGLAGMGCAGDGRGPETIKTPPWTADLATEAPLPESFPASRTSPGWNPCFDDLASVLAAAVSEDGSVDATELAVHLPRLERQLARLARPWPVEAMASGSDERLAWLCNARAAWSMRIVARELGPLAGRGDSFGLPPTMDRRRLLDSPFPLAGGRSTLGRIDEELASYDDFRLAVSAPGACDLCGPLPAAPFTAETMRSGLDERFRRTARDPRRWLVDHDARELRVPPSLWRFAGRLTDEYNRRYGTRGAELATALRPYLDAEGRLRMDQARGYSVRPRTGPAGIAARILTESERRKIFGY